MGLKLYCPLNKKATTPVLAAQDQKLKDQNQLGRMPSVGWLTILFAVLTPLSTDPF